MNSDGGFFRVMWFIQLEDRIKMIEMNIVKAIA